MRELTSVPVEGLRNQQYRAVKSGIRRILSESKPEERGGVIWHTQGRGMSLAMLWLAIRIRREPRRGDAGGSSSESGLVV